MAQVRAARAPARRREASTLTVRVAPPSAAATVKPQVYAKRLATLSPAAISRHAPAVRALVEEEAGGQAVAKADESGIPSSRMASSAGAATPRTGAAGASSRRGVDEDVGLARADLQVDAVEAEAAQRVEDAVAARAVGPGPVVAVELRHEPAAVDVDGEPRQRVALLVHEAEGGRARAARVEAPEPPAPLQRAASVAPSAAASS